MAKTGITIVQAQEEVEDTLVSRVGRFLGFETEWWETVSTKHVGNDIHIGTTREIREVYLNGKPLIAPNQ